MIAASTPLPVIGVPVNTSSGTIGGIDALLSIAQMPRGVPVATVAIGGGNAPLPQRRNHQLAAERDREVSVCVLDKASELGAHTLSGAVLEPRALNELIPDWQAKGAPLNTPATRAAPGPPSTLNTPARRWKVRSTPRSVRKVL
jgi:hypothetical protein